MRMRGIQRMDGDYVREAWQEMAVRVSVMEDSALARGTQGGG